VTGPEWIGVVALVLVATEWVHFEAKRRERAIQAEFRAALDAQLELHDKIVMTTTKALVAQSDWIAQVQTRVRTLEFLRGPRDPGAPLH